MQFTKSVLFYLLATAGVAVGDTLSSDNIKAKVGDGCANSFTFRSAFSDDTGAACTTCDYCSGSNLNTIFDTKSSHTCIDCGNDCTHFQVITSFDKPWSMWFVSLLSSDAPIEDDPKKIILEGSNDFNGKVGTWTTLYNSDQYSGSVFTGRSEKKSLIFSNDENYKHYGITFVRSEQSSKIQVGNYEIIQAYTKKCASEVYEKLVGVKVPAQPTKAPTNVPTGIPTNYYSCPPGSNLFSSDQYCNDGVISNYHGAIDISECKGRCDADATCNYFLYSHHFTDYHCALFSSCDASHSYGNGDAAITCLV